KEKVKHVSNEGIKSENEKSKHVPNRNIQLKNERSKQLSKVNIELKEEKSEQIIKEHNESKSKKNEQIPKGNVELRNEKSKQIIKEHNELEEEKKKKLPKVNIELSKEKVKHVSNEDTQLKNESSKQFPKVNIELKEEKSKQIQNGNHELKKEKDKQVYKGNINIELNEEKKKQVIKEDIELENKIIKKSHTKKEHKKIRKNIISKVPIVIASFETEITDSVFTKIESTFVDIKEVKNNIFIEEANLIKLNSNKAKLFINGYIRSYIGYITLDKINKSSIETKNQGIISHKDFSKAVNIDLLFFDNMKEGEAFFVDFNNDIKDKKALLGKIERLDIKSGNIYKDVQDVHLGREKSYLMLQQNLFIRAKIDVLQKNIISL
ncbi:TPA: hypothetical protein PTV57_001263, partial [Clostridium botulinum]|nr:hypothetical protein [Clostridium botulinum]